MLLKKQPFSLLSSESGEPEPKKKREIPLPAEDDLEGRRLLRERINQQVDFYFGDANYPKDKYLLECASQDRSGRGFIDLKVVASFRKLKKMCTTLSFIEEALHDSTTVEVGVTHEGVVGVRRIAPVPKNLEEALCRTVLVEGIRENDDVDSLRAYGEKTGKVDLVRILYPGKPYPGKNKVQAHFPLRWRQCSRSVVVLLQRIPDRGY